MHILVNKKYLTYFNNKVKCAVGKRGIKIKKKEGDLITPKGTFRINDIFYRKDRIKHLPTKIPKKIIKRNMGWCDDPGSKKYNTLIKYPFRFKSEKLYRSDNMYDIFFVLSYNTNPVKKNKGSAIFIHVAKRNFSPTKGCIAINKNQLKKIAGCVDNNTKIKII